jgi:hypothetical protein
MLSLFRSLQRPFEQQFKSSQFSLRLTASNGEHSPSLEFSKFPRALAKAKSKSKLLYDWRSISQYVLVSGIPLGPMTRLYFFFLFCQKIVLLFILGRPLGREAWSIIFSAICLWSESRGTRNCTLLSYLRLLGSLYVGSYDSQGLRWKYFCPPPHGGNSKLELSYL